MTDIQLLYVRFRGKTSGPFSIDDLKRMAHRDQISRLHQVSMNQKDWHRAGDYPELKVVFASASNAPTTEQGNSSEMVLDSDHDERPKDDSDSGSIGIASILEEHGQAIDGDNWYYSLDKRQFGPVAAAEIHQLLQNKRLTSSSLVWQRGMESWRPIMEVESLPSVVESPVEPKSSMTTEKISPPDAERRYAGFWLRVCAAIMDKAIVSTMIIPVLFQTVMILAGTGFAELSANRLLVSSLILTYILIFWLYHVAFECSPMQGTLGKMALMLYVTDTRDQRLSFGRATARHFSKYLSSLLLGAGFFMVAFTEKKQGLHDMVVETYVQRR